MLINAFGVFGIWCIEPEGKFGIILTFLLMFIPGVNILTAVLFLIFAVYQAVQKNKPLFERIITVTGKSLAKPSNFLARIGTPMKQLIDACGGLPEDTGKIIGGGPMMGKALVNTEVPTAKGSSGILIMNQKEAKRGEAQTCIRCAKCVSACPMGLESYLLGLLAERNDFEGMEKANVMDCIECGSCQFTCPANRPLLDYCRYGKNKVGAIIRARQAK